MGQLFLTLEEASFHGVKFPIRSLSVRGGFRDHVHEYPHSDGGSGEKLGRKLYTFHMKAIFSERFPKYPGLWPKGISTLRTAFDLGSTGTLVVPTIGSLEAYCTEWEQTASPKMLSGEEVELTFREDNANALLPAITEDLSMIDTIGEKIVLPPDEPDSMDLFDALKKAMNLVSSIKGFVDMHSNLLAARLENLASACEQLDALATWIKKPINHSIADALHDLWAVSQKLAIDVRGKTARSSTAIHVVTFRVPVLMSISQVANAVYGDSSRGPEILRMNPIHDPMAIPAGTNLKVIKSG